MNLILKDPLSVLDYRVDWGSEYLVDDQLTSSTWSVVPLEPGGVTVDGSRFDGSSATVQVSGGRPGKVYRLLNHVVTSASREDVRSMTIRVDAR